MSEPEYDSGELPPPSAALTLFVALVLAIAVTMKPRKRKLFFRVLTGVLDPAAEGRVVNIRGEESEAELAIARAQAHAWWKAAAPALKRVARLF